MGDMGSEIWVQNQEFSDLGTFLDWAEFLNPSILCARFAPLSPHPSGGSPVTQFLNALIAYPTSHFLDKMCQFAPHRVANRKAKRIGDCNII